MARQTAKNLDKVPVKRGAGVTKRRTQNVVARAFRELKRGRLLDYVVSTVSVYFVRSFLLPALSLNWW